MNWYYSILRYLYKKFAKSYFGYKILLTDEKGVYCNVKGSVPRFYYDTHNNIKGKIKIARQGLHFCDNLIDCFNYYEPDIKNTVVYSVKASGIVTSTSGDSKRATSDLELVKKLDAIDLILELKDRKKGIELLVKLFGSSYKLNEAEIEFFCKEISDLDILYILVYHELFFTNIKHYLIGRINNIVVLNQWVETFPEDLEVLLSSTQFDMTDIDYLGIAVKGRSNPKHIEIIKPYLKDSENIKILENYIVV